MRKVIDSLYLTADPWGIIVWSTTTRWKSILWTLLDSGQQTSCVLPTDQLCTILLLI